MLCTALSLRCWWIVFQWLGNGECCLNCEYAHLSRESRALTFIHASVALVYESVNGDFLIVRQIQLRNVSDPVSEWWSANSLSILADQSEQSTEAFGARELNGFLFNGLLCYLAETQNSPFPFRWNQMNGNTVHTDVPVAADSFPQAFCAESSDSRSRAHGGNLLWRPRALTSDLFACTFPAI